MRRRFRCGGARRGSSVLALKRAGSGSGPAVAGPELWSGWTEWLLERGEPVHVDAGAGGGGRPLVQDAHGERVVPGREPVAHEHQPSRLERAVEEVDGAHEDAVEPHLGAPAVAG